VDAAVLRRLDGVCAAGYRPEDADSALGFLDANRAFHVAVADLSGNARLARQVGRLLDESTRMLVLGLKRRDRSGEMAHEHAALIEALALGRADAAAALMHEQVAASRAMVLDALTAPPSGLSVMP
jgi:DNA-binding GntR family transcriptional regulator